MHAKHRNGPGNGYRSNIMGMGGVAASRIPPEGSMRGYRMYNSEYRNYNRGGGGGGGYGSGGHSKQYQPPMPPPREADIFIEAGKMAAEYLVSKGMLPPNALSGKWQSDGLKNQVGNFQGVRSNEAERIQNSADSRASAHSRLGNAVPDVGPGRRKYSDEYNSVGSRSSIRGRKRTGSFKSYGSEVSRELGRSGSLTERVRPFHSAEAESDASVGNHGEPPADKDGNYEMHNSSSAETSQQPESETQIVSGLEKRNLVDDAGGDSSTLSNEKCLTSDANGEAMKNDEPELVKEQNSDNNLQQKNDENKEVTSSEMENTVVSKDYVDLAKQCKFVNVPTKARSSLTSKSSKGDQNPTKEGESISKREPLEDSGVHIIDVDIENLAGNAATHQNHEFKSLHSDDPTSEKEKEMNITYPTRSALSLRSESFPERSLYREQQSEEGMSGFGRSKSMLMERGEKRAMDCNPDGKDDFKKLRQWVPQNSQPISSPPVSSSMESNPLSQEPSTSQSARLAPSPDQNSLDISLFPKDHADSCEFMQEKQLFPSSFKTCDLNLIGACDVNENHDADPMLVFPSITQTGKAATPIDVDLSMGNNGNMPSKVSKHIVNEKDIEIIDLEKDSAHEDKTFGNPDRRGDTVFTDLDGFPNNVPNANGMPDVQDGYGLMISELLGNDSPNCASVPTDLNSLHNHMGLPNAEGILGDDDSIYMSLGEIPISMLGAWEQPSQDYGKPF